jgi:hypothetical protein
MCRVQADGAGHALELYRPDFREGRAGIGRRLHDLLGDEHLAGSRDQRAGPPRVGNTQPSRSLA